MKSRKKKRKGRVIFVSVIVILLIALLLVPLILSSRAGKDFVLGKVNDRIDGELSVENWSLRWIFGTRAKGVHYSDTAGNCVVQIEEVTTSSGILGLLGDRKNIGRTEIIRPKVVVVVRESSPAAGAPPAKGIGRSSERTVAVEPPAAQRLDIKGSITVTDGETILRWSGEGGEISAEKINGSVDITSLAEEIRLKADGDITFSSGPDTLAATNVSADAAFEVQLSRNRITVRKATVETQAGDVVFSGVRVPDWRAAPDGMEGTLEATLELAPLMSLLGDFSPFRYDGVLAGSLAAQADVELAGGKQQVSIAGSIVDMVIGSQTKTVEETNPIVFKAECDIAEDLLTVTSAELSSSPLVLSVSGTYSDWQGARELEAGGVMECDLARLSDMFEAVTGTKIDAAGRRKEPFSVDMSLRGDSWQRILSETEMSAALYVQRLTAAGITISGCRVPITISAGKLTAPVDATANGGRLVLNPTLDLTGPVPVLTLPDNSTVLRNAELTDEMADELMSRIHPVFKGSIIADGKVNLIVSNVRVPIHASATNDCTFEGKVFLKDVSLGSSGLFDDVIDTAATVGQLFKIRELREVDRLYTIGDQDFTFQCEAGRISAEDLRVGRGDFTAVFSGSIGLDQTLDYRASIPVTEKLVGEKVAALLEGESASLPITGTLSDPEFDGEALGMDIVRLAARAKLGIAPDKSLEDEIDERIEEGLRELGDKLRELFE
jgi:hypothetical protein